MDINPANKGHVLVIPREHYEGYLDLPDELAGKLAKAAKKIAKSVLKTTGLQGFNILNNNGEIAGQIVTSQIIHCQSQLET